MSDLTWLREQAAATEALADLLRAHDIDRMECHDHPDDVCCPSCHDLPPGTSQTQHYAHVLIAESPLSGLCVLSGCRRVAAERLVEENRGTLDGIEATGSAPPVEERIQDVIEGKAPDDDGYAGPVLDDHQSRAAREILVDHAGPALEQAVDIAQHAPFRATIEVTMDQEQRVHFTAHRPDDESVLLDVFPAATHAEVHAGTDSDRPVEPASVPVLDVHAPDQAIEAARYAAAVEEWSDARRATSYDPSCPECVSGKHDNCDGTAWDSVRDRETACRCAVAEHRQ